LSSETAATSSQASLTAPIRGRKKRNAAPPMEANTPAKTPSGSSFKKDRRDLASFIDVTSFIVTV
jgi:hypothetical protein